MSLSSLHAHPMPYGGAVNLHIRALSTDHVVIVATQTADLPDPNMAVPSDPRGDTPDVRLIHDGLLTLRAEHQQRRGELPAWQISDLATRHLPDGERVYYWVFQRLGGGAFSVPLRVAVTPGCLMETQVQLIRDVVMPRLEYHLRRGVRDGAITSDHDIEVLEQESLNVDHSVPLVLVKERVVPNPAAGTIGDHAGEYHHSGVLTDEQYREYRHPHRVTLDILTLTDSPSSRAELAQFMHGVLVQDRRYWDAAGLQNVSVQRQDIHMVEAGVNLWNVDLTLDCEVEFITREDAPLAIAEGDVLHDEI